MSNISRRDLLKICAQGLLGLSGALGLAGLVRFLSFEPDPPPPQQFDVGPTSNYLLNTRTVIKEIPAILINSYGEFNALSLVCQHLGCTVDSKADGFVCPCHGSKYGPDGELLKGPAEKGLNHLKVEVTPANRIIIYKS
jgi:cytochrome b6-f complex iron-sulfur subunit